MRLWGVATARDAAESKNTKADLIWTIARGKFNAELCSVARKTEKTGGRCTPFYTEYHEKSDAFNASH